MDTRLNEADAPAAFRRLLAQLTQDSGQPVQAAAPRVLELLLPGDLPLRATVLADDNELLIDVYAYTLASQTGPLRAAAIRAALTLNHIGLRGRPFAIGLDARDFIVVSAVTPLDDHLPDRFAEEVGYLAAQAQRIRELFENITLAGAETPVQMSVAL